LLGVVGEVSIFTSFSVVPHPVPETLTVSPKKVVGPLTDNVPKIEALPPTERFPPTVRFAEMFSVPVSDWVPPGFRGLFVKIGVG